jgi:signal transduction histidine kinase
VPLIQGDRVQVQQVIMNLIINAIEAMSEVMDRPRELFVSAKEGDSDHILVEVCDSGPGLPPAALAYIFEPFFTTKSSGLGMGLSICRSIVEAHGGRLWARENEPRGAVLCMTLPIERGSLRNLSSSTD